MENSDDSTDQGGVKNSSFLGDLTDGRAIGDWKSRYDLDAKKIINLERNYLIVIFICSLLLPLIMGILTKQFLVDIDSSYQPLKKYIAAFFGGVLGGTMYSAKWLVHSVAKNNWNEDRHLWRIFTPFVSGALAFCILLLIHSRVLDLANTDTLSISKSYGVGFLMGYFSDNAIGKLAEVAKVFFGSTQK